MSVETPRGHPTRSESTPAVHGRPRANSYGAPWARHVAALRARSLRAPFPRQPFPRPSAKNENEGRKDDLWASAIRLQRRLLSPAPSSFILHPSSFILIPHPAPFALRTRL